MSLTLRGRSRVLEGHKSLHNLTSISILNCIYCTDSSIVRPALLAREGVRFSSSLRSQFKSNVEKLPYKNALKALHQGEFYCYAELDKHSEALANGLLELGLKSGDKVATWMGNDIENAVTQVAAAKAGFVLAAIDPALSDAHALSHALSDSKASALIYNPMCGSNNDVIASAVPELVSGQPGVVKSAKHPNLKYVLTTGLQVLPGGMNINNALVYGAAVPLLDSVKVDDKTPYLTTYSKANGGKSDGKTLTQGQVLQQAQSLASKLKLNGDDKILSTYTHSSEFGTIANFAAFSRNSTVVVPSGSFDEDATTKALEYQEATQIIADSDSVAALKAAVSKVPSTVRGGAVGGQQAKVGEVDLIAA